MVKQHLTSVDVLALIETLIQLQFNRVGSPLKSLESLQANNQTDKENLTFVKQRRTISKLLVVLFRDFAKLVPADEERMKNLIRATWGLSFNNMIYL